MELVRKRRMEIRSDQPMEAVRLLRVEPKAALIVARATHAQPLEEPADGLAADALEGLVVEDRLPMSPTIERSPIRAIVSIPHRHPAGIHLGKGVSTDRPASIFGVQTRAHV